MFKQALLIEFGDQALSPSGWELLGQQATSIKKIASIDEASDADLSASDALFLKLGGSADKDLIDRMPNLSYIGMFGTGFGKIDTEYAAQREVTVTNVQDYSSDSVAEFLFGALLEHFREISRAKSQAASGDYLEDSFVGRQISSMSFGVVGLGNIGRRVAEIAADGFGCDVKYWSASPKEVNNDRIKSTSLEEVLSSSDVVSLNLALNPQTEGFINSERIALLKPNSVLVNTAPMELIDLAAIEKRLKADDLYLIFDHPDEMKPEDAGRLTSYPACESYPPIGYTTADASEAKERVFIENIFAFGSGTPQNKVN